MHIITTIVIMIMMIIVITPVIFKLYASLCTAVHMRCAKSILALVAGALYGPWRVQGGVIHQRGCSPETFR